MLSGRRVLLGVSGGIAAYKAADLVRRLCSRHAQVTAVMTANACRFITPLTLRTLTGRPVATEMFADPSTPLPHISLAQWAELIVVAPATADLLARAAGGRADDLLAAVLLDTPAPILWAPAMNTRMWEHPVTQANVRRLREAGHHFVGPDPGDLACGESGQGRLAAVDKICEAACRILVPSAAWKEKKVLITAGPTREPWDPIRFLSNRSSGKMGYALAAAARLRGASVTLVSGPVALDCPAGVRCIRVTTALEMQEQTLKQYPEADVVIATAAVADFRPAHPSDEKLKKGAASVSLELVANPDILMEMGKRKAGQILVGFAAESGDLARLAAAKRAAKNCDLMVANLADAFDADESQILLVDRDDRVEELPRLAKIEAADRLLDRIEAMLRGKA